jgi:hypothetical protein
MISFNDAFVELFLNADEVKKLHDFEQDVMEHLLREREQKKTTSIDERIGRTAERLGSFN